MEPTAQRTGLAQSRPLPIAVLVNSRCLVTDSAGHDIRAGLHRLTAISPDAAAARYLPPAEHWFSANNEPALRFVPELPRARLGFPLPREGKGPGQRLRTGARPVGHGLGPRCLLGARALSRPNPPVQPDERSRPFLPVLVPRLAQERLAAGAAAMA